MDKVCMRIPLIIEITSCTLPAIESKEAFQADKLSLILSTLGWKWHFFSIPLNIGAPRYKKGRVPMCKPRKVAMVISLWWEIAPE